jgi:hypothetical protein
MTIMASFTIVYAVILVLDNVHRCVCVYIMCVCGMNLVCTMWAV